MDTATDQTCACQTKILVKVAKLLAAVIKMEDVQPSTCWTVAVAIQDALPQTQNLADLLVYARILPILDTWLTIHRGTVIDDRWHLVDECDGEKEHDTVQRIDIERNTQQPNPWDSIY